MLDRLKIVRLRSLLLLSMLIAGGCSKSFVVTSEVPQPLIERMPISAKLDYSEEFRNYVYVESGKDRALERVDFGKAQVGMFETVFSNLLTLVDDETDGYDLKVAPEILDFQYSVPAETKLNHYEIWVKYRLQISDRYDNEIADWVVKGYGKTPTSFLATQLSAFNSASNVALRDIGAQLAIGFSTQPSIEDFVNGNRPSGPLVQVDEELDESAQQATPSPVSDSSSEDSALETGPESGQKVDDTEGDNQTEATEQPTDDAQDLARAPEETTKDQNNTAPTTSQDSAQSAEDKKE